MGILNDISNFLHGGVSNNYHDNSYGSGSLFAAKSAPNPLTQAQQLQAAQGQIAPSGGSGGGRSSASVAPAVNPYQTAFLNALPGQLSSIHNSEAASGNAAHAGLSGGINDLVAQLTNDQSDINEQRQGAELGKIQGSAGVLSMVQHGLQSGGITLANKGASNSSAAEALARAYSDIGRRAQTQVGGQYAQAEHSADVAQDKFNVNRNAKGADILTQKTQAINSIVADAQNKLAYLASQAASASVPDKVNIDAEMQTIRNQATGQLADIDQALAQGVGAINPASQADLMAKASQLNASGTAAATPFNFSTVAPPQAQGGPVASELPIFTNKKTT